MQDQFEKPLLDLIGNGSVLVLCQAFALRKACVCRRKCWLKGGCARQVGVVDAAALAGRFGVVPCGHDGALAAELGPPVDGAMGGVHLIVSARPKPGFVVWSRIEGYTPVDGVAVDEMPEITGQVEVGRVSLINILLHGSGANASYLCWGEILCILPGISVFRFLPRLGHSVRGTACDTRGSRLG